MRMKLEFGSILILAVLAHRRSSVWVQLVQRRLVRDMLGLGFGYKKTAFTQDGRI